MKHPTECNDDNLKSAILGDEAQREAAFRCLYEKSGWREWVIAHVKANRGQKQDGEDVFQEAVVLFDRGIRQGKFRGGVKLKTYFFGIAKWVWFNTLRKRRKIVLIPEIPELEGVDIEAMILEEERKRAVHWIISHLNETCRKVLPLYMLCYSNKEIAEKLGLSSFRMANKYVDRCRKRFEKFVMENDWLQKLLNINNPGDEK